jgi:murein DD-endopeptidase MepM/ murein hydrolase activator NlpD
MELDKKEIRKKRRQELLSKLKAKYRLVIMNDQTFEEKVSLKLSPLNVFVVAGSLIIFLITGTIYTIAFTPLREYIPGYADVTLRRKLVTLLSKTDSLETKVHVRDEYIEKIKNVISGNITADRSANPKDTTNKYHDVGNTRSKEDSLFRAEVEGQEKSYSLAVNESATNKNDISSFFFFSPLSGVVTSSYNANEGHLGVDVAAAKNEAIKAALDGTVIQSAWSLEYGYTLEIQHNNNLISIYKHNSAILKKSGERVSAGDVIAIIGNTGEITTGPHLHFELWYNGTPINPQDYINF